MWTVRPEERGMAQWVRIEGEGVASGGKEEEGEVMTVCAGEKKLGFERRGLGSEV